MIRVVICDDHEMVRQALAKVLALEEGISVIGVSEDMESTCDLIHEDVPDVLLVDVRLKNESGLDVARMVAAKHPEVKIIVLTSFNSDQALVEAYELGARAFILKSGSADELIQTVRDVSAGMNLINPVMVREAAAVLESMGFSAVRNLDNTDRQIALFIAQGQSDKQIAENVFLGLQTVRNRVSRLLTRFEKDNRTQLALFFAENHDRFTE
jgi:DNA-binding NarL/FixJ family response regulator